MPPDRCLCWVAALFCAVLASASMGTKALASGQCLLFQSYDSESATVALRNSCSESRHATIKFCDGYTLPIAVPADGIRRVRAFSGCIMRVTAERSLNAHNPPRAPYHHHSRKTTAPKDSGTARSSPSSPAQGLLKRQAALAHSNTHSAPGGSDTHPQPAVPIASPPSTGDGATAKKGSALNLQQDAPAAGTKPLKRSPLREAVFPNTSDEDWEMLSCSVSGQTLIHEAEALLTRKEVLQALLAELWFSAEADKKQDEWTAAQKEIQAIERELGFFNDRASAVIAERAAN